MLNRQLRRNIKALDVQIGELTKELEGLKKDTKYDVKMRTIGDLVELRSKLTNNNDKEKSDSVIELERQIEEMTHIMRDIESDEVYIAKMKKLDELTKIRCQLAEGLPKQSNMPAVLNTVVTGVIGISAIILILKYEEDEIITSKAFSIATRLIRGV